MLLRLEHRNDINLIVPWFRHCGLEGNLCLLGANEMTSNEVGLRLELGLGLKLGDLCLSGVEAEAGVWAGAGVGQQQ